MAKPGYKINQLAHSFSQLKKGDKDFLVATIQDSLHKILGIYEKSAENRSKLVDIAQTDIIEVLSKGLSEGNDFHEWIKKYVKNRIKKYQTIASKESIEKNIVSPKDTTEDYFSERPYQTEGIALLYKHFLKTLRKEKITESKKVDTAALLNAATGSGKSFMVGDTINKIFRLRERIRSMRQQHIKLRILVLSDRIGTLRQTRGALVDGYDRGDMHVPPIFDSEFRDNLSTYEFHSGVETDDTTELITTTPLTDNDTITFSTFQTAGEKDIGKDFNIILIAEGHHLPAETFYAAFEKYYQPTSINGTVYYPWVLTDTATADGALLDITGNPVFSYPLYEYLASPWAPEVTYHIVSCQSIKQKDIGILQQMVGDISSIVNPIEKYRQILELKRILNSHLAQFPDEWSMVDDFLDRVGENIGQTLVVCGNKKEADKVRNIFAQKLPTNKKVMSYHSTCDEVDSFDMFANKEVDVLTTVNMLIESIDMPAVEHIVLWRNIRSRKQYMQVLGRGMRGKHITYWDYVGGYANFTRITDLYRKVEARKQQQIQGESKPFTLLEEGVINVGSESHTLDILTLMHDIEKIESELEYKEASATDIHDMFEQGLIHISDITPQRWTIFARKWNTDFGIEKFTLPTSFAGLIGVLGGDTDFSSSLKYVRALLQNEEFSQKPVATKAQLQDLWSKGVMTKEYIAGKKYPQRATQINDSDIYDFDVPTSVTGLHTALYRYQRNPNTGVDRLESLLNNTEFIPEKIALKDDIISWAQSKNEKGDDYMIPTDVISPKKYTVFAKKRNQEYGKTLGILPHTLGTLARRLGVPEQTPYIVAALQGNEVITPLPLATKEEILELWQEKVFTTDVLSNNKRHDFAKKWNIQAEKKKIYTLPKTMRHLFTVLGGKGENVTRTHTAALLDQTTYIAPVPKANKRQLLSLYKKGIITDETIPPDKWIIFSEDWNAHKSKKEGYMVPSSYKSLITHLGGDYRYDQAKDYTKALFKQEHYIRTPFATQEQIHTMLQNNIFPDGVFAHKPWEAFVTTRNEQYAVLRLCKLPISLEKFGKILLEGTGKSFTPDVVKKHILQLQGTYNEDRTTDENIVEPVITTRKQMKIEKQEKVKLCKIKAKIFFENKEFSKAYALYYHAWTLDPKDILVKSRMNEIKKMGIEILKSDAVIALREIEVKLQ